ncbi:MAG: spermidine synthase [Flammeovirgaceae bacterium]|nr:spermidine synthase [Flammeovirgaceae bacterium]
MTYSSDHQLKTDVEGLIIGSGFTVLKFIDHAFDPQGYTALWLLAESHCALHTFPEEQKAYLEISSCNSEMYVNFVVAYHQYIKDGKN